MKKTSPSQSWQTLRILLKLWFEKVSVDRTRLLSNRSNKGEALYLSDTSERILRSMSLESVDSVLFDIQDMYFLQQLEKKNGTPLRWILKIHSLYCEFLRSDDDLCLCNQPVNHLSESC